MAEIDGTGRSPEHHRAGLQVLRWRARIVIGIERALRNGHIVCRRDEFGELRVGHLVFLHPEPVDADLARESARLQSLQVKQQLGAQALSIANQAPSIVLSFFR